MKGRLGGAVGGSPARLGAEDALCLQMWAAERGGWERRRDFPVRLARMQTDGTNRYSLLYPFMNSRRYWRVIREPK